MDLVILAAGMGSRFGGLKQAEPIDKNGNFIIDYSIFDAIKCGFDMVMELPTIYSISSAENFAEGAIKILEAFGDVTLSFGSEVRKFICIR